MTAIRLQPVCSTPGQKQPGGEAECCSLDKHHHNCCRALTITAETQLLPISKHACPHKQAYFTSTQQGGLLHTTSRHKTGQLILPHAAGQLHQQVLPWEDRWPSCYMLHTGGHRKQPPVPDACGETLQHMGNL